MHRLVTPDWDAYCDYEEIVERSNGPTRDTRTRVCQQVKQQYENYRIHAPNLEKMLSNVTLNAPFRGHLMTAYAHGHMADVKEQILARQRNRQPLLATHCQLCSSMNLADSWDHYLPQQTFPELAACAYNIVPSCDPCNKAKNDRWLEDASRSILHLYYDHVPEDGLSYLWAEVSVADGQPTARFEPRMPAGGDVDFFVAYCRHFKSLKLAGRFADSSALQLLRLRNQISDFWPTLSEAEIVQKLRTVAEREPAGRNSPQAALSRAAADSPAFLAYTRKGVP